MWRNFFINNDSSSKTNPSLASTVQRLRGANRIIIHVYPNLSNNTMLLPRLPIPVENTLITTPLPKHQTPYPRSSQTRPYCPSLPHVTIRPSRGVVLASQNATVESKPAREAEPLPPELVPELIPKHVAVIMDGNGRWAKMRGLSPSAGHEAGVQSLRRIIELCCSWGIKVLTVFAFSYDNWVRPKVSS